MLLQLVVANRVADLPRLENLQGGLGSVSDRKWHVTIARPVPSWNNIEGMSSSLSHGRTGTPPVSKVRKERGRITGVFSTFRSSNQVSRCPPNVVQFK